MLVRVFLRAGSFPQKLLLLVLAAAAVIVALYIHDLAQALAASLFGDETARIQRRLSFNPFKHIEPFGFAAFIIFFIGWARPANIRSERFRSPRFGTATVSLAGPFSNFVFGNIFVIFWVLCAGSETTDSSAFIKYLMYFLEFAALYNFSLGFFELLPIPSLDGANIVGQILPEKIRGSYFAFERYGLIVAGGAVLALHYTGVFDSLLDKTFMFSVTRLAFN